VVAAAKYHHTIITVLIISCCIGKTKLGMITIRSTSQMANCEGVDSCAGVARVQCVFVLAKLQRCFMRLAEIISWAPLA
jgi:hypothetical protein